MKRWILRGSKYWGASAKDSNEKKIKAWSKCFHTTRILYKVEQHTWEYKELKIFTNLSPPTTQTAHVPVGLVSSK